MLNLAVGGGSTFISDIGGYFDLYTPPTTAELFTRWSQLSALTPVMRIHDDTIHGSLYPWSFDAATLDAYRRYARLHKRLMPLLEHWTKLAAKAGVIGPVRPLVLADPSPRARAIDDEWLLGSGLLVAPVTVQGAESRHVYLPAGATWQRVTVSASGALTPTGRRVRGGRTVTAPAPLTDIPLYVRVCAPMELRGALAGGLRRRHRCV
jgi:alpha-glucosidase (family GH31 glycosyl hydrolase)